jgi:glycerol kinase
LLFNIHTQSWDDELLKVLDIPRSVLPEVLPSSGIVGETTSDLLGGAVPVAGVAGDQQAALFGQGCLEPGTGKNTYGTGCFVLMNTGEAPVSSKNRLISTVAWQLSDRTQYALEGSIFIAGAAVQWLRDGLGILRDSSDVEALATSVDDTGGVTFVLAFAGLGAPHWDPYARGTLLGLSRGTTSAHIARATLEAIGHQVADVVNAMQADSGIRFEQLRVDGGAASNDFLMQFQADILGVPVVRPQVSETTALGAAYLAGLATGYWKSAEALGENLKIDRIFEPSMSAERRDALREEWRRALERAKAWASA